jgi:hypothetical protein
MKNWRRSACIAVEAGNRDMLTSEAAMLARCMVWFRRTEEECESVK